MTLVSVFRHNIDRKEDSIIGYNIIEDEKERVREKVSWRRERRESKR